MGDISLSAGQRRVVEQPVESHLFLEGPAGCGKTTAGVHRLRRLLENGVPASSILILVPQRTLATPYYDALHSPAVGPGGEVTVVTIGGLAQRMVDLFWPLVAAEAGFAHPDRPPTFLTLETTQYHMARLVRPLLEQHYFDTIVIDRNRLYSQIVDNLNKAAVVGFPITTIGERLKAAWQGDESQRRVYDEAQTCALRFREYCLAHNLLDFSLQVEVFRDYLWASPTRRAYLLERYRHLLVDNVEESVPLAHDILRDWLPAARSALLIYDTDAGYRRFLGADPEGGHALGDLCDTRVVLDESFVSGRDVAALGAALGRTAPPSDGGDLRAALVYESRRFYPQMLDWVADEIGHLVHIEHVPPGEIVVLAPFLSDALRFALTNRLAQREVAARSHRPSRALRDEPATRCLLTLAAIAHPEWGFLPSGYDVTYALMQAIADLDLVRAQLLTAIVYRTPEGRPALGSFDRLNPEMQERLTFALGGRYERLREWLAAYAAGTRLALDHFLAHLFGDLLSQEGYGFHRDYDGARVAASLIESVRKFRQALGDAVDEDDLGREYLTMVQDGVIAAQYVRAWRQQPEDAVLLSPAYTFLMSNRPVEVQFWLDVGGRGWWERLYQPLTHPYVLSRHWPPADRGPVWTDGDEVAAREEALRRLILGLTRRCRRRVYLGLSLLGEQGYEQKGPLLQIIQRALRTLTPPRPATTARPR